MTSKLSRTKWLLPAGVFTVVVAVQLWFVAAIGTDIPFQDQWDYEGGWLYPGCLEGKIRLVDLFRPANEHRFVWSVLLNLGLFSANGQWDPLVQLVAIAVLRGACAAGVAWLIGSSLQGRGRLAVGVGVVFAFLPHLAWNTVLWGATSSDYFVLGFSVLTLGFLGSSDRSAARTGAGLIAGVAALVSMAPGAFVPVSLLGLSLLRAVERRRLDAAWWREAWPALVLLAAAGALRVEVPAHAVLQAATPGQFFDAFGRAMAWPHVGMPAAALVLNLPLAIAVGRRCLHRRGPAAGEDFVLLLGGWSIVAAAAMGWARGGGDEFVAGVPSRYVDFLVLLPVANAWCAVVLAREAAGARRRLAQVVVGAWGVFLLIGWLGLSAQVMRGLLLPRMRDRDITVRLAVAFQQTDDPAVFAGQPRLLVPHPNLESVRAVLHDPRMRRKLQPSFQLGQPMGPLSRAARVLLKRDGVAKRRGQPLTFVVRKL